MNNFNIEKLDHIVNDNNFYILREDCIPEAFGGNKVRIAYEYINDMILKKCNALIAYGSPSSNLCRVLSILCRKKNIPCYVVFGIENDKSMSSNNAKLIKMSGADITFCKKNVIAKTIETLIYRLKSEGLKPYYIYGDKYGKGNELVPMKAYEKVFDEIVKYEIFNKIKYDYIFLASGTSTTQSGLLSGCIKNNLDKKIIGISIARKKELGERIIAENLLINGICHSEYKDKIIFIDDYLCGGYGISNEDIKDLIIHMAINNNIMLDPIYTGKAFWGMNCFIEMNKISKSNILFIHTGGIPIFYDFLNLIK